MITCTGFAFIVAQLTCTSPAPAVPAARYCQLYQPVRYSRSDTAETRRQLRVANARYRSICK